MQYGIKKIIIVLLCAAMLLPMTALADEAEAPAPVVIDLPVTYSVVKVGLCFGSSAAPEAILINKVGSGFAIGYFDFSRSFHELGRTDAKNISAHSDNAWHVLLNAAYTSFDEANQAAKSLKNGFVGYIDGQYRALSDAYADEAEAGKAIEKARLDAAAFTGSADSVALTASDKRFVFLADGADTVRLALSPLSENKAETWFSENAYYGDFEVFRSGNRVSLINYIALEDYVKGVLPYEVGGTWDEDALMAQAVCARSYAVNNINAYPELGFDVRNDTYSQVYRGLTGTVESTNSAAEATAGQYVRYNGTVCKVYYMSCDGGATDSGANVFGQSRAYLKGTEDPYEKDVRCHNKDWKCELRASKVESRLKTSGLELNGVAGLEAVTSELGNVIELTITDNDGRQLSIYGEYCFRYLTLNSIRYELSSYETDDGETVYVFDGHGWGHNCGLSQWGAYAMAGDYGKSCHDIIGFYFNGAYIG